MPMNKAHYPKDWLSLRAAVLVRAKNCCECRGECGATHEGERCAAPDHALIQRKKLDLASWVTAFSMTSNKIFNAPIKVILTTAHTCQESTCNDLEHLRALCQCCHLRLDAKQHAETRAKRKGAA
jgi:hypothetical protein